MTGQESAADSHRTSIIIPVYNHWSMTQECLTNIRDHTPEAHEVIVVDNGSDDETALSLQKIVNEQTGEDLRIIYNQDNRGFPRACNQGMAAACGDTLVILNNDVVVSHNWLHNLLHCLYSKPEHGLAGPVTNWISGSQQRPKSYTDMEEFHIFAHQHNQSDPTRWTYSLRLVGFCLAIRREVYQQVGGFDERFGRGNFEDDDYCMRVRRAGYKLVLAGDTYVHHHGSVTSREDPEYVQLLTENCERFTRKWGINPLYSLLTREDLAEIVPQSHRVLDVGCACGGLGLTLKNRGVAEVDGIELDPRAAVDAQTVLNHVWIGDATDMNLPRPTGWYDALVFADVLEHLVHPLVALQHLVTYLRPGGVVVASLPNVGHIDVLQGLLVGTWTYQPAGVLDHTHVRFFTLVEMQRLFAQAGLSLEFVGMVQNVTAEQEQLLIALEGWVNQQNLPGQGPSFGDRCRTVQYYLRARRV